MARKVSIISIWALLIHCTYLFGTTYYVCSSSGSDNHSGLSPALPWQSITKVNSQMLTFKPGDSILFKSNDIFAGSLRISCSGSNASSITFSTYGGSAPARFYQHPLLNWTAVDGDIWATDPSSNPSSEIRQLFINGKYHHLGRYPNEGDFTIDNVLSRSSYLDEQLASAPNLSGAEMLIDVRAWYRTPVLISSHQGSSIQLTTGSFYGSNGDLKGRRYWIRKHINVLDAEGEWFHNTASRQLYIYSKTNPNLLDIKVSNVDSTIYLFNCAYVSLNNLSIAKSNSYSVVINNCSHIFIADFKIDESARNAVTISHSNHITLTKLSISKTGESGVVIDNSNFIDLNKSTILDVATFDPVDVIGSPFGINVTSSNNCKIEKCIIQNTAYTGVFLRGNHNSLINNIIKGFCLILQDGGGIYTLGTTMGNVFRGNIVSNTNITSHHYGIYLDDYTQNVTVVDNICTNNNNGGIHLHDATSNVVKNNVFANNGNRQILVQNLRITSGPVSNTITNNFCLSSNGTSAAYWIPGAYNLADLGTIDENYYLDPYRTDRLIINSTKPTNSNYSLADWKSFGIDLASKPAPVMYTNPSASGLVHLLINESEKIKRIHMGANRFFLTPDGQLLSGLVTLNPFTAKILFEVPIRIQSIIKDEKTIMTIEISGLAQEYSLNSVQWMFPSGTTFHDGTSNQSLSPVFTLPNDCQNCPVGLNTNLGLFNFTFVDTRIMPGIYINTN